MTSPSNSGFQLPRLSRMRRSNENRLGWGDYLGQAAFIALLALSLLGSWMTVENTGIQVVIRQTGYGVILVMALIALQPWRHPERLLVVPWPILLALGWCWLSTAWMIAPDVGLRRLVLTTIVAWSVFALARQIGPEKSVDLARTSLAVMLAVNYATVILYPEIGIHGVGLEEQVGKWRGLMGHKNFAGIPCVLAILFFVFDASRVHAIVRVVVCTGALVFLFMSESKTSMGVGATALAVGGTFHFLAAHLGHRPLAPPAWAWLLLLGPAYIVVSMAIDNRPYLEMVSDPAGFTGRTQIWTALIKAYADHPWLGVGFGSFWDLGPSGPIYSYARDWVADMSEGHNSYLDWMVQIGGVGTLIVLFAVIVWPTQRILAGGNHPARPLCAAIIVFAAGHSFTESQLLDRDSLVQVFTMLAIALLWSVTAAQVEGGGAAVPDRPSQPSRRLAPLRL